MLNQMKQLCVCAAIALFLFILHSGVAKAEIDLSTVQKLVADDGAVGFGQTISVDGNTAIISNPDPSEGASANTVYVFTRSSNNKWSIQQKLTVEDGKGWIGAASMYKNTIVIYGMTFDDSGHRNDALYVFIRSGTTWYLQQKITGEDIGITDSNINSISLNGDTIVIGGGFAIDGLWISAAYILTRSGGIWSLQQKIVVEDDNADDISAQVNSLSIDGNIVIIGATVLRQNGDQFGAAYFYTRSGSTWEQRQMFAFNYDADVQVYVDQVFVDGDTSVIFTRSGKDSNAYIFTRSGSVWSLQQKIPFKVTEFGSVSVDGDIMVIGIYSIDWSTAIGTGSAYIYTRSNHTWNLLQHLAIDDGSQGGNSYFGGSVSVSGKTVIIGYPYPPDGNSGSAYVLVIDDSDNDGITDADDKCPKTAPGDVVNSIGCSIAQICPCDSNWKNHGKYTQCLQSASGKFLAAKLITKKEREKVMISATKSQCGRKSLDSIVGSKR
jgi:hypothetical protein